MDAPGEVAKAIDAAKGDIVTLIRGGGAADGFAVFDDERVINALGSKAAFRIVGIGHSVHHGIADLVADYSASTPTAAGAFIERQLQAFTRAAQQFEEALARERSALAAATLNSEQKNEEIYGLRSKVQAQHSRTKLFTGLAFLAGVFATLGLAFLVRGG
jgi:exonuclease VII large subunit